MDLELQTHCAAKIKTKKP